jgi:hypothetical protein
VSEYLDWQTYMGLNAEAGQAAGQRLGTQGAKLRGEAEAAGNAHYGAAREGGAQFEQTGERARKGLASYSEFMQGMADPAARQALMEKTYGKGAVSAIDAAMTGGGNYKGDFQKFQNGQESQGMRADERRGDYGRRDAISADAQAQEQVRQQGVYDKNQAAMKKRAEDDENASVDAYGRWYMGDNYNPNQAYGGTNYSGEGSLNQATGGGSAGNTSREYMRGLKKQHEARTGRAFRTGTGMRRGSWDVHGDNGDSYAPTPPANSWAKKHGT